MKNILLFAIKVYQYTISPYLPPSCRYHPTCSKYAFQAISKYGAIKGSYFALIRILKCNPLFPGGVDYIP